LVGLLAAIFALLPHSALFPTFDTLNLFRWHHSHEFHFTSWHGLSMIIAISFVGVLLLQSTRHLLKSARQIKILHALAEPDKNNFFQLDSDMPMAFTAGYSRPRRYVTSALRRQLNADEYRIVQLHEDEHARRRDPLQKWFFQLLASFFPPSAARRLNQQMVLAMEQCADMAVSSIIKDKAIIATTLVRVKRLSTQSLDTGLNHNVICHYGLDGVSERITYLLSSKAVKVFPIFPAMFATISMALVCVLMADVMHHAIEYPFSH